MTALPVRVAREAANTPPPDRRAGSVQPPIDHRATSKRPGYQQDELDPLLRADLQSSECIHSNRSSSELCTLRHASHMRHFRQGLDINRMNMSLSSSTETRVLRSFAPCATWVTCATDAKAWISS